MMINIGDSLDPFYRYQRPIAIVSYHARCTSIDNLNEIAKALQTNAKYLLHYIKIEKSVGVLKNNDIKSIIDKKEIEDLINKFIKKYLLCTKCHLPEIIIKIYHHKLFLDCNACGNITFLPENQFTKIIYKDQLK